MIAKPFDKIEVRDINDLVTSSVGEGRSIEYKALLPGTNDEDKREFLADVSSFANGGGGDIIYGITEVKGVPDGVPGVNIMDADAEILHLENLLRDGVDPRIPGILIKAIHGFPSGSVFIIRVPRSWLAPHVVKFKNWFRFFTRHNARKEQMNVVELRSAFALSDSLPDRMRKFRDERLGRISAGDVPVKLVSGPKLILHLMPVSAFSGLVAIPVKELPTLRPVNAGRWDSRFNIDGRVTFSAPNGAESRSYCQIFRSGCIECVYSDFVASQNGRNYIRSTAYEKNTLEAMKDYFGSLTESCIQPPLVLTASLLDAAGVYMYVNTFVTDYAGAPVDRSVLLLPDVLIEDYTLDIASLMRPIFDAVWNACGFEGSQNYDKEGKWAPKEYGR